MSTITKRVLSGQETAGMNPALIVISATANTATMIHQGTTNTTTIDQVFVYAINSATTTVTVNITMTYSSTANAYQIDVPAKGNGPELIIPGFLVAGVSGAGVTGVTITCGASTSNVVSLYGEVNRIVQ